MRSMPHWLIAMFVGVVAAALAGAAGANALVALLAALVAGLLAQRVQRDALWTAAGRAAWSRSWLGWSRAARGVFGGGRATLRGARERSPAPWWPEAGANAPPEQRAEAAPPRERAGESVPVRCEVATERLQVWHSTVTQRAYEVPTERGVAGARPGSLGALVYERGRARVVPRDLN